MGEIKSAFEKAWERVEKLGKLSPEELRERKEAEYTPVGRTLADKYLRHGYGQILQEEVNRYDGEEKEIVTTAALSTLVAAVQLQDYEIAEKAIEGILVLKGKEQAGKIKEEIRDLHREHEQTTKHTYEEGREQIERWERELLHQLRISGDAIGEINLEASHRWKKTRNEIHSRFDERLAELRQRLLDW